MGASDRFLNPAEAARRLGVSPKALRLYEERGLIAPLRTTAGWRAYGPEQMARAGEIAALRALGFSLTQVVRVIDGEVEGLEPALAAHQQVLETQAADLAQTTERVRALRATLAQGGRPALADLTRLSNPATAPIVSFDLPWTWGGERFELRRMRAINFIIGPLGSGKTRLACAIAEHLPGATFLGLERPATALTPEGKAVLAWIVEDGGTDCDALTALVCALSSDEAGPLVVDMIEQGLDAETQAAVIAWLRRRGPNGRPLFAMTRSSAILDLTAVGPDEAIILCPANHSPPTCVESRPGAPGYEAVATCLASPEARARTAGVIAWRPAQPG